MNIIINGQNRDLAPDTSLKVIVDQFARKPELVIAELNGNIIDRAYWDKMALKSEDKVELVTFVGGG
jgi:sulfur carrier protein